MLRRDVLGDLIVSAQNRVAMVSEEAIRDLEGATAGGTVATLGLRGTGPVGCNRATGIVVSLAGFLERIYRPHCGFPRILSWNAEDLEDGGKRWERADDGCASSPLTDRSNSPANRSDRVVGARILARFSLPAHVGLTPMNPFDIEVMRSEARWKKGRWNEPPLA